MTTPTLADHAVRYDEVPYPALVHPQSHPRVMGAMAALFGLDPAPVATARVLDLGCATGSNLLSLAAELPDATFVGVDLSARQIALGRERAHALGLTNLRLDVADLADDLDLGSFDYVICHGVYSWVAPPLQRRILAHLRRHLARPHGVAYLSFNTYPGWHFGDLVRQLLLRRTSPDLPPLARVAQARAVLTAHTAAAEDGGLHKALLLAELELIGRSSDAYLYHEHFVADHHPAYFEDVAAAAAAAGLTYLSNARPDQVLPGTQPPNIAAATAALTDPVALQQAFDHHFNNRFRRALFTHAEHTPRLGLDPRVLARLHVSLPRDREVTTAPDHGSVTNRDGRAITVHDRALLDFLVHLRERAPASVPLDDLVDLAHPGGRELAGGLVGLFFAQVLDLTLAPITAAAQLPDRPRVPLLNRVQATAGEAVTSRVFVSQELDDVGRRLVPLLDGTRDIAALAAATGEAPDLVEGLLRVYLDCSLFEG